MSVANDGGPAFPALRENNNPAMPLIMVSAGMSLRDWFAGQALVGMLGCGMDYHAAIREAAKKKSISDPAFTALCAYEYADAILRAREAKP